MKKINHFIILKYFIEQAGEAVIGSLVHNKSQSGLNGEPSFSISHILTAMAKMVA